ncbi:PRC-barrel domain-containing protein [Haladaptatus pallidirubidus]|uniref:PRC-barrel domain-containing protein n=1 Tax=Haladaptatus pallidirubidus TaxID=1008152 RepID=A0AAV3UH47_9EURY|nr:PRC-barrel domain-containing protein [Haladaptatus pallidirubidus]
MSNVFIQNIIGMDVSSTNGVAIGTLKTVTMNMKTGKLSNLIVEPTKDSKMPGDISVDENGQFQFSISKVRAVNDHIIVGPEDNPDTDQIL